MDNNIFDANSENDIISLKKSIDVNLKKLKSKEPNKMKLLIHGSSIDFSIVNALRRTVMLYIPIYGFHRSNINIENDKTVYMYNNDLTYMQIETLPIYDIPNDFDLENPELYLSNDVLKNMFSTFLKDKVITENKTLENVKKIHKIELSLNVKNNTSTDLYISTHHCTLKVDDKISNSYTKREPICILVLKPLEEISLNATANLSIAKMLTAYEATTNAIHIQKSETSFVLIYETLGQLSKEDIFNKACKIIIKKLENLLKFITDNFLEKENQNTSIEIELYGEEHTLSNLITTTLQKMKDVLVAGYVLPHQFVDKIIIKYKISEKSKLGSIEIFINVLKYLIEIFHIILDKSQKL